MPSTPRFRHCKVSNCDTYSLRGLYTIPEHPTRRQSWIEACNFPENVSKDSKVCWKHFKNSDFKSEIDFENITTCHFPRLNSGAIPSLFDLVQENEPENILPSPIIDSITTNNPTTVVNKYLKVEYFWLCSFKNCYFLGIVFSILNIILVGKYFLCAVQTYTY